MDWPDCLRRYEPQHLTELLEGLVMIPESLYRAHVLEHTTFDPPKHGDGSQRLSWHGYSQDSRLLLDIDNRLELIGAQLTAMAGGKAKPSFIDPPNAPDKRVRARPGMNAAQMLDLFRSALT